MANKETIEKNYTLRIKCPYCNNLFDFRIFYKAKKIGNKEKNNELKMETDTESFFISSWKLDDLFEETIVVMCPNKECRGEKGLPNKMEFKIQKESMLEDVPINAKFLSTDSEIFSEYGKTRITRCLDNMDSFSKYIITVELTILTFYVGFAKYLSQNYEVNASPGLLFSPVIPYILSILILTMAIFRTTKKIVIDIPTTIEKAFQKTAKRKYLLTMMGTIIFLLSIAYSAYIIVFHT